ncbi:hypothetical protein POM88_025126 [Heracleum sosnowskyi]|uniref:Uncharacterized protein n=1 Tax=Heracleum sosnowskyi TaxID=360622 RepID=A0AAD8I3F3_9APIA|nr:hypothetical protein POM88_025126 [Heracleum sosnowskyi]
MGRGPNHIPEAPANPDDRTLIQIYPGPNSMYNWPTPAITWASTPSAHKDAVWAAEFQVGERECSDDLLFFGRSLKDNLPKEREKPYTVLASTIQGLECCSCTNVALGRAALIYGVDV